MDAIVYGAGLASYHAGVLLRVSVNSTNLRAIFSLVCADDGMPYGALSVNVPDADLAEDEILASADWNLPADLKVALLGTGKFVQTGRWNQVGLGSGEIWRIADPDLLSHVAAARVVACRTRRCASQLHSPDPLPSALSGHCSASGASMYVVHIGQQAENRTSLAGVLQLLNEDRVGRALPRVEDISVRHIERGAIPVVRLASGNFAVRPAGTRRAILTMILDEVDRFIVRVGGKVLRPHEMSRASWGAVVAAGRLAYFPAQAIDMSQRDSGPLFQTADLFEEKGAFDIAEFVCGEFVRRFGYGTNGPLYAAFQTLRKSTQSTTWRAGITPGRHTCASTPLPVLRQAH